MSKNTETSKKSSTPMSRVLPLVLAVFAGFSGGWIGAASRDNQAGFNISDNSSQQLIVNESQIINKIAEEVGPSVVSVNVIGQERSNNPFFGFGSFEVESAGTGFIISDDGVIVTNRHVVPVGTSRVSVTLSDGTELEDVEVIGRTNTGDPLDIAFLKIRDLMGNKLTPAKIGDSTKVEVGDKVVAIGNALGQFQNTVTSGIISGFGRNIQAGSSRSSETLLNLFQTDAAINQGNSGGPLVNINGEVIGVNTAVAGGGAENIGFSIPINDINGLIQSVLKTGELKRPFLGVRFVSLTDDLAFQFDLDTKRGAYIVPSNGRGSSVVPDSPAEQAGIQEGDIITKVNDTTIDEKNSLTSVLGRLSVGDDVNITINRNGNEQALQAILGTAPEE